jgi:hypothetical protein
LGTGDWVMGIDVSGEFKNTVAIQEFAGLPKNKSWE